MKETQYTLVHTFSSENTQELRRLYRPLTRFWRTQPIRPGVRKIPEQRSSYSGNIECGIAIMGPLIYTCICSLLHVYSQFQCVGQLHFILYKKAAFHKDCNIEQRCNVASSHCDGFAFHPTSIEIVLHCFALSYCPTPSFGGSFMKKFHDFEGLRHKEHVSRVFHTHWMWQTCHPQYMITRVP